ncbi:hypothetical protein PFISCL1PPCAC_2371, partial [Pristionchus fissidentatus]
MISAVVRDLSLVALLVVVRTLLPHLLIGELVPLDSGGLGDIGRLHSRLLQTLAMLLHPDEEGGGGPLGHVGVLGLLDGLSRPLGHCH